MGNRVSVGEHFWFEDLVMMKAKGLVVFAEENWPARQGQGISYIGSEAGIPLLVAFAGELALKAWKLREGGKAPLKTHNLVELFSDVDEAGQERLRLGSKSRVVSCLELEWSYPGLDDVLESCKNVLVEWRYSHEQRVTVVDSGLLLVAVKDIVIEYERDGGTAYRLMDDANEMYRGMLKYMEGLSE